MKKNRSILIILLLIFINIFLIVMLVTSKMSDKKDNSTQKDNEKITQKTTTTKNLSNYDIPKIYFKGNIKNMTTKKDERNITLEYIDGDFSFKTYAKIKIQGTTSIYYDKKNYTINLYSDEDYEIKNKIDLGWGKQSKYCLKANWIDKTHARNVVTAQLASDISRKYNVLDIAPNNGNIDGYPIEIYSNGSFLGIYTWNIPKDGWMFNMEEDNENHILFSNEGWEDANLFRKEADYETFSVEHGREDKQDLEKINRLITFVKDSTDEEFKNNIEKYINKDAAINYFIMLEFAELFDNVAKNMLLATYDGKVWYPTLYDLDTSWGTDSQGLSLIDYEENTITNISELWSKLETNFSNNIAERYFELRKDILTKENIINKFTYFSSLIPKSSLKSEKNKWKELPGYDISQIEDFLNVRIPLIDDIMSKRLNK